MLNHDDGAEAQPAKQIVITDLFALEPLSLFLDGFSIIGTVLVSSHTVVLQDAINHIFLQHHKLTQPPAVESNTGINCATSSYTALTVMQWQLCQEDLNTYSNQECYNNKNNTLQAFQLIVLARYLLGVPKS